MSVAHDNIKWSPHVGQKMDNTFDNEVIVC